MTYNTRISAKPHKILATLIKRRVLSSVNDKMFEATSAREGRPFWRKHTTRPQSPRSNDRCTEFHQDPEIEGTACHAQSPRSNDRCTEFQPRSGDRGNAWANGGLLATGSCKQKGIIKRKLRVVLSQNGNSVCMRLVLRKKLMFFLVAPVKPPIFLHDHSRHTETHITWMMMMMCPDGYLFILILRRETDK